MTILVVDDEELIRTLSQRILVRAGHEVLLAESGKAGLQALHRDPAAIDLVVVDMSMADLSGTDLLREMRRMRPDLRAIISSGRRVEELKLPEDLVPNTLFLQKPYRPQELIRRVQAATGCVRDVS
ncbi:MAG TPA: response regulator [Acidobacteriota bacterium]|nr:response regulator [Acidobacteriota bacterium]